MATWPEWNLDTEWVRLDGPFATGGTGVLKPKGGPRVPFVIERLVPDREFLDVSRLLGARLAFDHQVRPLDLGCELTITVSLTGPLRALWKQVLGKGIVATAQADLDRLVARAEAEMPARPPAASV